MAFMGEKDMEIAQQVLFEHLQLKRLPVTMVEWDERNQEWNVWFAYHSAIEHCMETWAGFPINAKVSNIVPH